MFFSQYCEDVRYIPTSHDGKIRVVNFEEGDDTFFSNLRILRLKIYPNFHLVKSEEKHKI